MYQGCNRRGVFSKLSNFPLSTMWKWTSTDPEVLVHFHIEERGKLESLESLENIPNFSNFFRGLKRPLVSTVPVFRLGKGELGPACGPFQTVR